MKYPWHAFYDEAVSPSIEYPAISMIQLLEEAVSQNPRGIATLFFGAAIRYKDLLKRVEHFAACLYQLGVRPGDRVALMLPNLPIYPIAHFAVLRLGAILVPTNPLYVERELAYQLNDSGAETVILLDKLYPRMQKVRGDTSVKRIILTGVKDFLPGILGFLYGLKNKNHIKADEAGVYWYSRLMKKQYPVLPPAKVNSESTAIFLYTGGTTGLSKGAVLTHRNLLVNVIQTRNWLWRMRDGREILLCVLPFFHSYGMTTGLHLAVATQSTMLLVPRFDLKEVLGRIRKHRPTVFCGVPSMYNAINHSKASRQDVGSIRLCISGGSGLPDEVQKRFEELTGGKLVEGYGLSETSPVTHVNPLEGKRKIGFIGVPVSDTEAKIVDPDTRKTLKPGEIGELAVKGPQVMQGYWNRKEETQSVLQEDWLFTGDMALMDEDGFFKIVDRKKDLIISAGMNIYPREVEEVLMQHPKVMEAAVIGVPSKVREETVKAIIVTKEGETLTKAEIHRFCKDKLSHYKVPREVEFREDLPKSTVGKILKRVLKAEQDSR